jgi:urease accessory protein
VDCSHLKLFVWLSPAFPVGAFAYSHGLEWAVETGDIHNADSLVGWLGDLLAHGSPRNDALLLAAAFRAAETSKAEVLESVNELALALASSRERRLETLLQGQAFATAVLAAWPSPGLAMLAGLDEPAYPVAVGIAASAHGLALQPTIAAYASAFIANLVSAAVRLGPIGQTDGQKTIATLLPDCEALAVEAAVSSLDQLGGAAFRSELAALNHETQYTRLFRS